jgi:hypothetical protein
MRKRDQEAGNRMASVAAQLDTARTAAQTATDERDRARKECVAGFFMCS